MEKSKFHILIVEDDATQGPAILAAFQRAGYTATLCTQSSQALTFAQHTEFHCLYVDCMLPGMNGVDLTSELLNLAHKKPKIFLTSGIYKDKSFVKEAMEKTGALAFFPKPIELGNILEAVERSLTESITEEHKIPSLNRLYASATFDNATMMRFLNAETNMHAFHLPKLYQRIMETTLTGQLSLIGADGEACEVSFFNGQIFSVKTPLRDSLFGGIAVSFGFVTAEDLTDAFKDQSKKMIGQKLIDSMLLSPHALKVILEEQMALRLSQTIGDGVLNLDWEMKTGHTPDSILSATRFQQLCADWLESKLDASWMKETLLGWGLHPLQGHLRESLRGSKNVAELLQNANFKEPQDLLAVFAGLLFGKLHLGLASGPVEDFGFLASRLERLENNYKTQNFFQFLGISEKSHPRDLTKAFDGFKNSLSPESLPADCPEELVERAAKVLRHAQRAFETLSSEIERPRYISMLNSRRSQDAIEAEPIFRAAILDLVTGQYKGGAQKFKDLSERKLEFRDLRAYRIWAGLRIDRNYNDVNFDQVPPEERHSPAFLVARGVSYHIKGQFRKALECYRSAHAMDPDLNIARLEVKTLGMELEKNRSAHRDLIRDVMAALESMPKSGGGRRRSA